MSDWGGMNPDEAPGDWCDLAIWVCADRGRLIRAILLATLILIGVVLLIIL